MPEIGTSGSMSGDGKRGVAEWPKLPRPSPFYPETTGLLRRTQPASYVDRILKGETRRASRARANQNYAHDKRKDS